MRMGIILFYLYLAKAGDGSVVPDSLRIDIPKDDIPLENRRVQGVKYLDLDTPERIEYEPILKVVKDALAKTGKR